MRSWIIAAAVCCASSGALAQDHILIKPDADKVIVEYRFDTTRAGFSFDTPPQPESLMTSDDVDVTVSAAGISPPLRRCRGMMSLAVMVEPRLMMTARSSAFLSSRTLPGQ